MNFQKQSVSNLSYIFLRSMLCFIFHILNMLIIIYIKSQNMNRRNWTQKEDEALKNAVEIIGNQDWTKISGLLRQSCETASTAKRTGKQCRQRWFNHLDPSVSKDPWTQQEQARLFEIHKTQGNKWKEISKYLPGRTDNDIKNRFYSTLRRSLRRLNKYIGEKNSTSHMREIRPSVLTIIINFIYENENAQNDEILKSLKQLPQLIFKFASFKPVKNNMRQKINEEMKQKINIILSLVDQFNDLFGQQKQMAKEQRAQKNQRQYVQEIKKQQYSEEQSPQNYNIPLQENTRPRARQINPIITIRRRSSTFSDKLKNSQQINLKIQQNEVKIEEEEEMYFGPILHPFEQNIDESLMPLEEPSMSVNQGLSDLGLVIIGKKIQPVEVAQEGEINDTNIYEVLYENYE